MPTETEKLEQYRPARNANKAQTACTTLPLRALQMRASNQKSRLGAGINATLLFLLSNIRVIRDIRTVLDRSSSDHRNAVC